MRIVALLLLATLSIGVECFTLVPAQTRSPITLKTPFLKPAQSSRCLRLTPKASLSNTYSTVLAGVANILLAVDSDGSKVDNLYNGIPATGAVEVCALFNSLFSAHAISNI